MMNVDINVIFISIYKHTYLPAANRVANIGSVDKMIETSVAATSSKA
jgi:hypothetical protein